MSLNSNPPAYSNNQSQVQQQSLKTSQINSEEQIVKFTVRQDFLNVIGIAADFQAGLECYKNDKNFEQMMTMLHNKLILQVNLSSSIHCDQQYECQKSSHLKSILEKEKINAKKFLNQILQEQRFDQKIEKHLKMYLDNCLANQPRMLQEPLNQTQYKAEFNQKTVQKIFGSINQTDQKYRDLQSGKIQAEELSESQINKYIQQRKDVAQSKLKNNEERDCKLPCQLI